MSEAISFTAPMRLMFIEEGFDPSGALTLPEEAEAEVRAAVLALGRKRAFGAVRVHASIGASRWRTSLSPINDGGLFLPVKKLVRLAEGLAEGDAVTATLSLI